MISVDAIAMRAPPAVLTVVSLTLSCAASPPPDAGLDVADVADVADGAFDAPDVADQGLTDIVFSERRDLVVPDGAVCEPFRLPDGGLACREENFPPGGGALCLRYLCDVDDGGTSLERCCRIVG